MNTDKEFSISALSKKMFCFIDIFNQKLLYSHKLKVVRWVDFLSKVSSSIRLHGTDYCSHLHTVSSICIDFIVKLLLDSIAYF